MFVEPVLQLDLPAQRLHDAVTNGQAEARALRGVHRSVKGPKGVVKQILRQAAAAVVDRQLGRAGLRPGLQFDAQ